jgi:hypothetical protein
MEPLGWIRWDGSSGRIRWNGSDGTDTVRWIRWDGSDGTDTVRWIRCFETPLLGSVVDEWMIKAAVFARIFSLGTVDG